ncbi:MAG: hypothetical protein A2W27_02980 [Deltaproteobacteria bacterium RBG_16_44_11]|nr:MAG: hypothetical protein A2W27_02980 [Deltaproteobacteria bacterium RBG_16_44_11]
MKKIILGIIIGSLLTLSVQYAWQYYQYRESKDVHYLFEIVKYDIENKLKEARFLNASVRPNSKATVNYVYDNLYDVDISYERNGKIKKITTQYGFSKGVWITPNSTIFEILDDKAETIYIKSKSGKGN